LEKPTSIKLTKPRVPLGSRVVCAETKHVRKGMGRTCIRKIGEQGIVRKVVNAKEYSKYSKPVYVEWDNGSSGWTKCEISSFTIPQRARRRRMAQREFSSRYDSSVTDKPVVQRRRMAQREFSSRRDSPVMVRLLEEIIAAQDK